MAFDEETFRRPEGLDGTPDSNSKSRNPMVALGQVETTGPTPEDTDPTRKRRNEALEVLDELMDELWSIREDAMPDARASNFLSLYPKHLANIGTIAAVVTAYNSTLEDERRRLEERRVAEERRALEEKRRQGKKRSAAQPVPLDSPWDDGPAI